MDAPARRPVVEALTQELRRASFTVHASFRQVLAARGLSWGQFAALRTLVVAGRGTTKDLARSMGVTTGNITGLVDKLELAGHVVRRRSRADRRVVVLEPTTKGRRLMEELRRAVVEEVGASFAAWSLRDLRTLERLLRRVIEAAPCDGRRAEVGPTARRSPRVPPGVAEGAPRGPLRAVRGRPRRREV